eukprot:7647371-Karenia_brevis.AAC.1
MREWVAREDKSKKGESQEKRRTEVRDEEEKIAKRVRFMQEREDTEEDKAFQDEIFGDGEQD